jgi:hypothetical protein
MYPFTRGKVLLLSLYLELKGWLASPIILRFMGGAKLPFGCIPMLEQNIIPPPKLMTKPVLGVKLEDN